MDGLLTQVAAFMEERIRGYCWPGKQAYSYYLQETTNTGTPTLRSYAALYVNPKEPGTLLLAFPPRAANAAGDAVDEFCRQAPRAARDKSRSYAVELIFGKTDWASLEEPLGKFLAAVVEGWKHRSSNANAEPEG